MRKSICFLASILLSFGTFTSIASTPAHAAETSIVRGKILYSADGKRLAPIYRVAADGSAVIILNDKFVTIPASTIRLQDGKLQTSWTKEEAKNR